MIKIVIPSIPGLTDSPLRNPGAGLDQIGALRVVHHSVDYDGYR